MKVVTKSIKFQSSVPEKAYDKYLNWKNQGGFDPLVPTKQIESTFWTKVNGQCELTVIYYEYD